MSLAKVLEVLTKLIELEEFIEHEIAKEKNARRRKKIRKACKKRDAAAMRKLLFDK